MLAENSLDDDAMAVLRAVLQPSFFETIRAGSRSTEQVAELVAGAIVPWFAARSAPR